MATINCRICGPGRPLLSDNRCGGCGTPKANCEVRKKTSGRRTQLCPGCGENHSFRPFDDATQCTKCGTTFDPVDFSFTDDRPEANAIKNEEYAIRQSKRN